MLAVLSVAWWVSVTAPEVIARLRLRGIAFETLTAPRQAAVDGGGRGARARAQARPGERGAQTRRKCGVPCATVKVAAVRTGLPATVTRSTVRKCERHSSGVTSQMR